MAPNPDTLLDVSDLVFIDAPTTGLSRPLGKAETKDLFGVDKDLDAFTRTIQRYLTKYRPLEQPQVHHRRKLWDHARRGLSRSLANNGVQLNGIAFVSTVLNIGRFRQGDQAY